MTRSATVASTTAFAFLIACGSEPKKDPAAAATATPPATAEATSPAGASSGAAAANAGASSGAAAPSAGAKPDKQAECDALVDEANQALDAERIAVDKACKSDTDCMPIKGRACGFNCATGAIPKVEEKDWTETLAKVKAGQCKKWDDSGCASLRVRPVPSCQDRKVWCDKGHCALKDK